MQQSVTKNSPFLYDLVGLFKHVNAKPPLHSDFDIREVDPAVMKAYDYKAKPFRHSFYCLTLFLQGDITLNTGIWKTRLNKPAIYFRPPCQIDSWQKPECWLHEYFIVFTESFLTSNKLLADIIFDLPFFQLERAVPFEIEPEEVELLTGIYKQIVAEYRSDRKDKFALIVSYVHTLLLRVRRLYHKYSETNKELVTHIHEHEHLLVENFRSLIRKKIVNGEINRRDLTIKYFAGKLLTHTNHLNAVVKRQKQRTAIAFMHEQILYEAQSLLKERELTIKEIAYRLGFADSSHFNHFFKKQTGGTPASYRKVKNL